MTALTGYTRLCTDKIRSGVVKIGLVAAPDVTSFTATSGSISAIALASGVSFAKYEFAENECEYKESAKVENGVSSVTQSLVFKLPAMNATTRTAVQELIDGANCGLFALVFLPSGGKVVAGYDTVFAKERPLRVATVEGTTGKAISDAQGEEITLSREGAEKALYFTGADPMGV